MNPLPESAAQSRVSRGLRQSGLLRVEYLLKIQLSGFDQRHFWALPYKIVETCRAASLQLKILWNIFNLNVTVPISPWAQMLQITSIPYFTPPEVGSKCMKNSILFLFYELDSFAVDITQ